MSSHQPLVSVIIPAYNAERFIGHTLNSVLSQTYQNIEILVVDDGSQDRTAEIVQSIAQNDDRVFLLQQSNAGVAAARNLAIQKSSGQYIAPIDADDIWYHQKLEKQVQCLLEADPSVGLVYAWSVYIDEQGLIIGTYNAHDFFYVHNVEGEVYTAMVYRNFIGNASVPLIRRACFDQVGGYNCQLKQQDAQGCEDWDIYLRVAECYQFRVVPEFLIGYRQVTGSMSDNSTSMARSYNLVMLDVQKRHPDIPTAIFNWSGSYFYNYLLGRSYGVGNHWSSIIWLYKALRLDYTLLLRPGVYRAFVTCLLKIAFKPVTSLIWQEHSSWLQFKQQFKFNAQVMTIPDINRELSKPQQLSLKPYDRVLLQRWFRTVQLRRSDKAEKLLMISSDLPST